MGVRILPRTMTKDPVAWIELTTNDNEKMNRFYADVLDVPTAALSMGDYDDYNVPAENPRFGICDPRSSKEKIPPGWIVYLRVEDLEAALEKTKQHGGEVVSPPQHTKGYGAHALIRDPAGTTTALFQEENP